MVAAGLHDSHYNLNKDAVSPDSLEVKSDASSLEVSPKDPQPFIPLLAPSPLWPFTNYRSLPALSAYIFTESTEVAAAVADLSPLLACSILLNSNQFFLAGVAVGAGWQSTVAYVNITCYYLIGIPVGVVLGYVLQWQVKGVWVGMLFGTLTQNIVLMIITYMTNWEKQV